MPFSLNLCCYFIYAFFFYALKRIPLNPKSTQFYRTIMREVQLISRLNHENVVRYAFNKIITDGVRVYAQIVRTDTQQTSVERINTEQIGTYGRRFEIKKVSVKIREKIPLSKHIQMVRFKYFTSRKGERAKWIWWGNFSVVNFAWSSFKPVPFTSVARWFYRLP